MAGPDPDTTFYTLDANENEASWYDSGNHHVIVNVGPNFYGATDIGYGGYRMDRPLDGDGTHWNYRFTPQDGVDTDDSIGGSNDKADFLYGGAGDDFLRGRGEADILVGGAGGDYLQGEDGADTIYGDWSDLPQVTDQSGAYTGPQIHSSDGPNYWLALPADPYDGSTASGLVEYPDGDKRNRDTALSGDDEIYGGDGSDVIVAGPGNDQIDAGPHGISGSPYTDDVSGGDGFDSFLLSYDEDSSSSGGGGYWSDYGAEIIAASGDSAVKNVTSGLVKAGASDALGSVASGMLGGTVGGIAGSLAGAGIAYLLDMGKSAKPRTNEDVLVIRDFNPAEDTLFLPFDPGDGTSLTATSDFYASSALDTTDLAGWGIHFRVADTTYAEVFLDEDWLAAIGIAQSSNSPLAKQAIDSILSTGILITPDGYSDTASIDPFGDADPDPLPLTSADGGTYTYVWGAYLPLSIVQPASSNGFRVGGTEMGDLLSINDAVFAPADYATFLGDGLVAADRSHIYGFGGDDVIFGGASQDIIDGGAGNDLIWSFDAGSNAAGSEPETLIGNDGHDRLIALAGSQTLRGGTGTDLLDGGSGSDTADYSDITGTGVDLDLATGLAYDAPDTMQAIGEFGQVTLSGVGSATVAFENTYADPVVIFGPMPAAAAGAFGSAPAALIQSLSPDGLTVRGATTDEPPGTATVDYLVVEAGAWELTDGTRLAAEHLDVSNGTSDAGYQFATEYFTTYFETPPAVVSAPQAQIDDYALPVRNRAIDGNSFDVALQNPTSQYSEDIGYVAIDRGARTIGGLGIEAGLTGAEVMEGTETPLEYETDFDAPPRFFGTLASDNDMDGAFLNTGAATADAIGLSILNYTGTGGRPAEQVSYIALASNAGDTLSARSAPDRLFSIENVIGSAQDDILRGDGLDNTFEGRGGADVIDGRDGTDTASYADSTAGVAVSLTDPSASAGGSAEGDVLSGIENLVGSDHADTLTGDGGINTLDPGLGTADSMTGGDGDDIFVASSDGDTIMDFEAGDLIDLSAHWPNYNGFSQLVIDEQAMDGSTHVYDLTLGSSSSNGTLTIRTGAAYDWSADDFIFAAPAPLSGTEESDCLKGTDGADTIRSLGGARDRMNGGAGADQFIFGAEFVNGVRECDVIRDCEPGLDRIVLRDGASVRTIRDTDHGALVVLEGDQDLIHVRGEVVTADRLDITDLDLI